MLNRGISTFERSTEMPFDIVEGLTGVFIEGAITFIPEEMLGRENKLKRGLKKVKRKPCIINEGEFKEDKTFHITQKFETQSFSYKFEEDHLIILVSDNEKIKVNMQTLERMFTGRRSKDVVCINTTGVDYLIQTV